MFDPSQEIAQLLREDKRYQFNAYVFVFEALNFAQDALRMGTKSESEPVAGKPDSEEPEKHVSGQELCEAIRVFALDQYGLMAKTVLNGWGIYTTGDFGEIVFNLISIGQMRKTPDDCREDFDDVYDFDAALRREFKILPPE